MLRAVCTGLTSARFLMPWVVAGVPSYCLALAFCMLPQQPPSSDFHRKRCGHVRAVQAKVRLTFAFLIASTYFSANASISIGIHTGSLDEFSCAVKMATAWRVDEDDDSDSECDGDSNTSRAFIGAHFWNP